MKHITEMTLKELENLNGELISENILADPTFETYLETARRFEGYARMYRAMQKQIDKLILCVPEVSK